MSHTGHEIKRVEVGPPVGSPSSPHAETTENLQLTSSIMRNGDHQYRLLTRVAFSFASLELFEHQGNVELKVHHSIA